jgi:hypothetical protein
MLAITYYLIANPLIAIGLAILIVLCIYNIFRRQVRVAVGMWFLVIVVLLYAYRQTAADRELPPPPQIPPPAESGGR